MTVNLRRSWYAFSPEVCSSIHFFKLASPDLNRLENQQQLKVLKRQLKHSHSARSEIDQQGENEAVNGDGIGELSLTDDSGGRGARASGGGGDTKRVKGELLQVDNLIEEDTLCNPRPMTLTVADFTGMASVTIPSRWIDIDSPVLMKLEFHDFGLPVRGCYVLLIRGEYVHRACKKRVVLVHRVSVDVLLFAIVILYGIYSVLIFSVH